MKVLILNPKKDKFKNYLLKDVGNNYGNLLFIFGLEKLLKKIFNCEITYDDNDNNIDFLAIALANLIDDNDINNKHINNLLNRIEKHNNKKAVLFSIGAQNNNLDLFKLSINKINLLNRFFSKFFYIYLRGKYTYDLLVYNNIKHNYIINGCPSYLLINFNNIKPIYNINNIKKYKILFNSPCFKHYKINTDFFTKINNFKIDFITQDNFFFKDVNKNLIKFTSFEKWNNICKKYNFIIGTRIHGAIMSLINNIPTLLIVMDSRTLELAKELKIPYYNNINNELFFKNKDMFYEFIINNYKINMNDMKKKQNEMIIKYKKSYLDLK